MAGRCTRCCGSGGVIAASWSLQQPMDGVHMQRGVLLFWINLCAGSSHRCRSLEQVQTESMALQ